MNKLPQLKKIRPLTDNQQLTVDAWERGNNLVLAGSAGTGKTFLGLYLALKDVFDGNTPYRKVIVVRSVVPTRDMGFLPGDEQEKKDAYTRPYIGITAELFGRSDAWLGLQVSEKVQFESTSFIRGLTWDDAIIVVDEMQNLNFHELDSVITRVGENTKLILCGDYYQSDFHWDTDKKGISKFIKIMKLLDRFKVIEFTWEDIVRSDLVKDYIMVKEQMKIKGV